jgi:hypothetical protein
MSCFTLLRLFNVYKWILIFIFFLVIDICCVKGWNVAHQIFACKEYGFTTSIMFISPVFVWVWVVLFFVVVFLFSTCSFPIYFWVSDFFCNNPFVLRSFLALLSLHCLILYCCLLVVYLFDSLIVVWIFDYFVSRNIFLQQYICLLSIDTRL